MSIYMDINTRVTRWIKKSNIPFFKINIIIFISAFLYEIFPILLTHIQILILDSTKISPTHILSYYTIPQAFVSFYGYNLYIWKKLKRYDRKNF